MLSENQERIIDLIDNLSLNNIEYSSNLTKEEILNIEEPIIPIINNQTEYNNFIKQYEYLNFLSLPLRTLKRKFINEPTQVMPMYFNLNKETMLIDFNENNVITFKFSFENNNCELYKYKYYKYINKNKIKSIIIEDNIIEYINIYITTYYLLKNIIYNDDWGLIDPPRIISIPQKNQKEYYNKLISLKLFVMKIKILNDFRRKYSAIKIQNRFRLSITNPKYKMCKNRILYEFNNINCQ